MTPSQQRPTVTAVVVTRNRLELLKQCLAAVRNQTRPADETIVIDNASDDGTPQWLAGQPDLVVIRQPNLGGAGGFSEGIKRAYQRGAEWFWCMDDDTIPASLALERLVTSPLAREERTGFLCSVVRWSDGRIHWMNAPNLDLRYHVLMDLLPKGALKVLSASFVSVLFHRRAVAAKGLPFRDMFLWFDDAEYTRRISSAFDCYQVLDSVVEHRTRSNSWVDFRNMAGLPTLPLSYGLRNFVFLRRWEAPSKWRGWARCLRSALRLQIRVWQQFSGADRRHLARAVWKGVFFAPRVEWPDTGTSTPGSAAVSTRIPRGSGCL